jgi:hypothetical protein
VNTRSNSPQRWASDLPAQHRHLVPQDQQLDVLGRGTAHAGHHQPERVTAYINDQTMTADPAISPDSI